MEVFMCCYNPEYIGQVIIIHDGVSFPEFIDLTPEEFEQIKEIFIDFPTDNPSQKVVTKHCLITQRNLIRNGLPAVEVEILPS